MREPKELSEQECRELLEGEGVGRVAFLTPLGPRIVPVNYVVQGWGILFRTTLFSELGTFARDADVAFEVDRIDYEGRGGRSVVAVGRAQLLEGDEISNVRWLGEPRPWSGGRREAYFRIQTREVAGRRVGEPDVSDFGLPAV